MKDEFGLRILALVCAAAASVGCASAGGDSEGTIVELEDEGAVGVSWEEYRGRALPRVGGGFIAEGDLFFPDESALRIRYEEMFAEEESKLVVIRRTSNGYEPTYTHGEQTNLTYCVSNTFTNKSTVVSDMAVAARSWEAAANLRFVYLSAQDASCTSTNANVQFAVMPTTDNLSGCAANKKMWSGSSPTWSCVQSPTSTTYLQGVLLLNYANQWSPSITWPGTIRHELGHMLGFRHEHAWAPSPCEVQDSGPPAEIGGRQLTPYDVGSVMHYPECNGVTGVDLTITQLDGEGARQIYGMPVSWYVPTVF